MKKINANDRSSDSYIGSVYANDPSHIEEIQELRQNVKNMNKALRESNAVDKRGIAIQYRVSLKGREAIEKAINHRTGNPISYYTHNGDVVGGIKNAGRIDVYIHRRYS